jgi:hypothetical protein
MLASCRFLDRHAIAKGLQLAHVPTHGAFGVAPVEVVGSQFLIRHVVPHHVVRDLEHLVRHGNDGFLMTPDAI